MKSVLGGKFDIIETVLQYVKYSVCTAYINQHWPLKTDQEAFQSNPDYLAKRPGITPTYFKPLW
jgi:hypothetical protein